MNNIRYYAREAGRNMFSHGFMSFAAIGITVACLIIMGTFTLIAYNAGENLKELQSENAIVAFLDDSCTQEDTERIGTDISAVPGVQDCTFVSRQEARDEYVAMYDENDLYRDLSANVFRHRYVMHISQQERIGAIKAAIDEIEGVAWVRADEVITSGFLTVRNVARVISIALVAVLLVVSLFIISNTIKLTTFDRREEIGIMKMVGADNWFIRWPFVFEGLFLGAAGGVLAFGLQWLLYGAVSRGIADNDALQLISVVSFSSIWYYVAAAFALAGILIGIGGSLMAIRRFLRV